MLLDMRTLHHRAITYFLPYHAYRAFHSVSAYRIPNLLTLDSLCGFLCVLFVVQASATAAELATTAAELASAQQRLADATQVRTT
jgi:hypothetical protein